MYRLADKIVAVTVLLTSIAVVSVRSSPTELVPNGLRAGRAYETLASVLIELELDKLVRLLNEGTLGRVPEIIPTRTYAEIGKLAVNDSVVIDKGRTYSDYASYTLILDGMRILIEVWV